MAALAILLAAHSSQADEEPTSDLITRVSYSDWQERLTSWKDDIVVVDFWATWCYSCIKRFPRMVELDQKYRDRGVRFVSMLLEDPDDSMAISMAGQFLARQNAAFEHFMMQENMMDSFEWLDLLGIPAVFIYEPGGALRVRLTGDNPNNQFTDEDIDQEIAALLSD